jgi:PAS domain S-box-containing protein
MDDTLQINASKGKILIVEDEWIIANDIKYTLNSYGYETTGIMSSGQSAINSVTLDPPDLILMDIIIQGDMDGIETAIAIRKQMDIPIIFVSANADEGIMERAKNTQPFAYLLKPFDDRELHISIEMALYRHKMDKKLRDSEKRFRSLVENAADAFYVCDKHGLILDVNTAACEALGYSQEELLSLNIRDIYEKSDDNTLDTLLKKSIEGAITFESTHIRKDGTELPAEVRMAYFQDSGEDRFLALARNITEKNTLINELQDALAKVHTLKSAIPVCVIKKGLTNKSDMDKHLKEHHNAIVDNGICQECLSAFKDNLK